LNAAAAQQLQAKWTALCGKLGEAHRALAAELTTGGHNERAQYHTQRALRFLPSNDKVIAQSGLRQIEGIVGDELDLAILQRSRRMDRTLQKLQAQSYATTPIAEPLGLLQSAGVAHIGVKSATFEVYGDWDQQTLASAAAFAERALAFWSDATEGVEGYPLRGAPARRLVFLRQKATWATVVQKHGGRDAQFVVDNASATTLGDAHVATAEQVELVHDLAVRWVTQDCSGLRTDAMHEGHRPRRRRHVLRQEPGVLGRQGRAGRHLRRRPRSRQAAAAGPRHLARPRRRDGVATRRGAGGAAAAAEGRAVPERRAHQGMVLL
jgi:hypothetical protein